MLVLRGLRAGNTLVKASPSTHTPHIEQNSKGKLPFCTERSRFDSLFQISNSRAIQKEMTSTYISALRTRFGFDEPILIGQPFEVQSHVPKFKWIEMSTHHDEGYYKTIHPKHIDAKLLKPLRLDTRRLIEYASVVPSAPRSEESAAYLIERAGFKVSVSAKSHGYAKVACVVVRQLNHTETRLTIYCHKF